MSSNQKAAPAAPSLLCLSCSQASMCWVIKRAGQIAEKNDKDFTEIISLTDPNFPQPPTPDPNEGLEGYRDRVDDWKSEKEDYVRTRIVESIMWLQRDCKHHKP